MDHLIRTLIAGLSFAHRQREMMIAGYLIPGKGIVCSYVHAYKRRRERIVTDNGTKVACLRHDFEYILDIGTPVIVTVTQNMDDEKDHKERVDIYNAETEEWICGNGDGNLPPVLRNTKQYIVDLINDFAGRKFAVYEHKPVEKPVQAVKEASATPAQEKAGAPGNTASVPSQNASAEHFAGRPNIEHDLDVATRLIHRMRKDKLTAAEFSHIGDNSRRYDGEWSRGNKYVKNKKNRIDMDTGRLYNRPRKVRSFANT